MDAETSWHRAHCHGRPAWLVSTHGGSPFNLPVSKGVPYQLPQLQQALQNWISEESDRRLLVQVPQPGPRNTGSHRKSSSRTGMPGIPQPACRFKGRGYRPVLPGATKFGSAPQVGRGRKRTPRHVCRQDGAGKNLPLVIRAFGAMHGRSPQAQLVMGGDGPARASRASRRPKLIIFAGTPSGKDLATHHAFAEVCLFPSLTEAFGNVTEVDEFERVLRGVLQTREAARV